MAESPKPSGAKRRSPPEVGPAGGPGGGHEDRPTDRFGVELGSRSAPKEWRPVQFHGRRAFELGAGAFFLFYTVLTAIDEVGPGFTRWLLPVVLGINTIHFLRRALDPRPRLALEEEGIRDRTSLWFLGAFYSLGGGRGGANLSWPGNRRGEGPGPCEAATNDRCRPPVVDVRRRVMGKENRIHQPGIPRLEETGTDGSHRGSPHSL